MVDPPSMMGTWYLPLTVSRRATTSIFSDDVSTELNGDGCTIFGGRDGQRGGRASRDRSTNYHMLGFGVFCSDDDGLRDNGAVRHHFSPDLDGLIRRNRRARGERSAIHADLGVAIDHNH